MLRSRTLAPMTLVMLLYVSLTYGHPSKTAHTHDDNTVKWERNDNGIKDGSADHNHISNRNFGGAFQFREPYSALGCWDNHTYRDDIAGSFGKGHCFINESSVANNVRYHLSSELPSGAKSRVRDAFAAWSAVHYGVEFVEGTPADVEVTWTHLNTGGFWDVPDQILQFDKSGRSWSYQKSKSGIPSDKSHFYSVALHEVGHVVGLAHQLDIDVMNPGVGSATIGAPLVDNGKHWDTIDNDSITGVGELYGQPPPSCGMTVNFQFCVGENANVAITATLPGFNVTLADYDVSFGGGPWTDIFEGALICPSVVGIGEAVGRAILQTQYGESQCEVPILLSNCGNNNPW